jgi:hypothetical protein
VALFVCNASFGTYSEGEIVTADPPLVSDWIEAQLLSEVDEDGNRLVEMPPSPGVDPATGQPVAE